MIEEVILKQVAAQNATIAETYQNKVLLDNASVMHRLKNSDYRNLLQDEEFIKFTKDTIEFFDNTGTNVSIYDTSGNRYITNDSDKIIITEPYNSRHLYDYILLGMDAYFLKKYISNEPLAEAFKGKTTHSLVARAINRDENKDVFETSFITSFIPIITSFTGKFTIDGVIEITTDITPQWDKITYIEKRVFIAFAIVFLVFFIIIMYNTNYAQRIINKQFETNRALEEAKVKAETESVAKTRFLANVSHELRTPLNAIIGFSEIIIAETYGKIENSQYLNYIQDINNSGKHLLSVINDILDFSKASADKLQVESIELDLNKLASSSLRFVKPRADEVSIKLIEDFPKEHIVILADPKRLKQALLNLLSNSVKFTLPEGSVTLSIKKDSDKKLVYIIVQDTGIGMSDNDIPKAMSSFGQIDNKYSRKYEGTGLGLPLTKKLTELMLGKFEIESKPGVGTKVILTFPYINSIEI
jgi:two-component system cell cycle sensor histidine kinase PleC